MMRNTLSLLAVAAAAALSSVPAIAADNFRDFTIDETSVPGTGIIPGLANAALVGDKLNGGFTEYVTFTSPTTFSAQAYASIGQIFGSEGTSLVTSLLNSNELVGGYRMYALFDALGTVTGGVNFTGTSASFTLYIDVDSNTTFAGTNGIAPITVSNNTDDYKIAFSNTLAMPGSGTLASAPGAFNFDFKDFALTTGDQNASIAGVQNGASYFVKPNPFHILVQVNGDNDQADGTIPNLLVTGDVSAVFRAPEPGSLALVGTLLAALGLTSRRRKS